MAQTPREFNVQGNIAALKEYVTGRGFAVEDKGTVSDGTVKRFILSNPSSLERMMLDFDTYMGFWDDMPTEALLIQAKYALDGMERRAATI